MTGLWSVALKFTAFAVVAGLLLVLLVNTMANPVGGDSREFTAEFADVNGLRAGDDVKAAGVRVGRVTAIEADAEFATVTLEVRDEQPVYDNTTLTMRYQNLVGQRYVAMVQTQDPGAELEPDAGIPADRTDPGFDLTELLNGFRPLFEVLQPEDVNTLAGSLVKVLQGEGGTVEQLLAQTADLTDFVADRDEVIGEVLTNLTPVLENLAGQGDEITTTAVELRKLMRGLARDRESIGDSIDGISQLVGSTSDLLTETREPLTGTSRELKEVAGMLRDAEGDLEQAIPAFAAIFRGLGKATSYENALNIYVCTLTLDIGVPLNFAPDGSGNSEVCRS
ncbi:MCE family protein [Nocardioides panacisoli]|uniref:MCE family protein n=1 Tax=Nocardioides panacisoli TaxID=627624 RepID=UPI001C6355DA|nr:MlaD family protein [Nocardioides panacisoli]QYJ04865.1 MCE family protein [Nocardioides panacisoli]